MSVPTEFTVVQKGRTAATRPRQRAPDRATRPPWSEGLPFAQLLSRHPRVNPAGFEPSGLAQDQVNDPAAADMRARTAQVSENVGVGAAGLFERVRQYGEAGGVQ